MHYRYENKKIEYLYFKSPKDRGQNITKYLNKKNNRRKHIFNHAQFYINKKLSKIENKLIVLWNNKEKLNNLIEEANRSVD